MIRVVETNRSSAGAITVVVALILLAGLGLAAHLWFRAAPASRDGTGFYISAPQPCTPAVHCGPFLHPAAVAAALRRHYNGADFKRSLARRGFRLTAPVACAPRAWDDEQCIANMTRDGDAVRARFTLAPLGFRQGLLQWGFSTPEGAHIAGCGSAVYARHKGFGYGGCAYIRPKAIGYGGRF